MFDRGFGIDQDYEQAAYWYCKAALQGAPEALKNCGGMYEAGKGVSQDYAKAAEYYAQGATLGHPGSMVNLGYLYDKGLGVTRNMSLAIEYYIGAAFGGNMTAARNLAYLYSAGEGVEKNESIAIAWLAISRVISGEPLDGPRVTQALQSISRTQDQVALDLFSLWIETSYGQSVEQAFETWPPTFREGPQD
jgi:TPR repeat protein